MGLFRVKLQVIGHAFVELDAEDKEDARAKANEIADIERCEDLHFTGKSEVAELDAATQGKYACLTCLGSREFGGIPCRECHGTGCESARAISEAI